MAEHTQDIFWRLINQGLYKQLVLILYHQVKHDLHWMLVPHPGQLIDSRVIPIHTLECIQVGIVRFLGICGRCATSLEGVVPRLHPGFVSDQGTSDVWVSEALLQFLDREFPQFTPDWQIIKRQIRLH